MRDARGLSFLLIRRIYAKFENKPKSHSALQNQENKPWIIHHTNKKKSALDWAFLEKLLNFSLWMAKKAYPPEKFQIPDKVWQSFLIKSRQCSSYTESASKRDQSGNMDKQLGISKCGTITKVVCTGNAVYNGTIGRGLRLMDRRSIVRKKSKVAVTRKQKTIL